MSIPGSFSYNLGSINIRVCPAPLLSVGGGVVYGPPQPHLPHLHLAREPLFDLQIHSFNSPGYLHPIVSHVLQMHINDHTIIVPLAYFCYRVPILIKRQGHLLPTLVIRKLLPPSHPHYILLVINYIAQLPK